jgi:hypothetical protein
VVQIRFELLDGSMSAWQPLTLAWTSHTEPDFGGPGCPCTSYTVTATPVIVPANARLSGSS